MRLLTNEEKKKHWRESKPDTKGRKEGWFFVDSLLQAQAELTEKDTLKKVGEWFKEDCDCHMRDEGYHRMRHECQNCKRVLIEALLRGEKPEGMK